MIHQHRIDPPPANPVADAYVKQSDPRLAALYAGHPSNPADWRERQRWLEEQRSLRADIGHVADALASFNQKAGSSARAMLHIDALREGALAVVGGQQAGLFIGPAMIVYKAVTVIQTAKWAEWELGKKVVPVFWIAGEDHDWDEVNHMIVPGESRETEKIVLGRNGQARTSVSRTVVPKPELETLVKRLMNCLPDTNNKPELAEMLRSSAEQSHTLTDLFARVMARLFAQEGLVLLDADDPLLRKAEAPMFGTLLRERDALADAYAEGSGRLTAIGYPLQAEFQPDSAQLFIYRDESFQPGVSERERGERVMLYRMEAGYADRKRTFELSELELLEIAANRPELLSNNVLSRPLMQEFVLPVVAAVLGPAEIAYWAQLGGAFQTLGMRMSLIVPRMSVTGVSDSVRKYMSEFGLTMDDVQGKLEEKKEQWLARHDTMQVAARFETVRRGFADLYDPLLAELPQPHAGLSDIGQTNRRKIAEQIDYMERKAKEALQLKYDAELRRFMRIGSWLRPGGHPQERTLHFAALWNQFGRQWFDGLFELPFDPLGGHYVMELIDHYSNSGRIRA